jgi:transcriptional regulator with XRE-family HTH domain
MRHKMEIDWEAFRVAVVACRGNSPRSAVSAVVGVSEPTLSRIEDGSRVPKAEAFLSLCSWLSRPAESFILNKRKNLVPHSQ